MKGLSASCTSRYTHRLGEQQWPYQEWLAQASGPDVLRLPAWRITMHHVSAMNIGANPEGFRGAWPETELLADAEAEARRSRESGVGPVRRFAGSLNGGGAVEHVEQ